jgi:F-type H+-transporting ATPase subunit epsilon
MSKRLCLTVMTPAEMLLDAKEVVWVQARLIGGGIGIYPGHAPLLAETVTAPLRYADPSGEYTLDLETGILQVGGSSVTIFTSGIQTSEVSETSEVLNDERFDRLAEALLVALRAQPDRAADTNEEK